MATTQSTKMHRKPFIAWGRLVPFVSWMQNYNREQLIGDVIAALVVAVMLVPQSMAYAQLAGLPPQIGLYASIAPLIIYGFLGSSRVLAVGPTALTSLLVVAGVGQFAEPGSPEFIELVLTLTLIYAVLQGVLGLARVGFLVNFLSHPVLSGFTSAAAIIIGVSQFKHLTGIDIPRFEHFYETLFFLGEHLHDIDGLTLLLAMVSIGVLLYFKLFMRDHLQNSGLRDAVLIPLTKLGPLVIVLFGTIAVWYFGWDVAIVGQVPGGLPGIALPNITPSTVMMLLPTAITLSLMGYTESISIAKSLASKRREKVDPNQELVALGLANFGAAITGGYPVTGGLSRSVVNYTAGARTGLASILTAGLLALTVMVLTPLFFHLPQAVLASIIVVAVASLLDFKTAKEAWRTNTADGIALTVTFVAVLALGIEYGILIGALTAIFLHLWQTSRPTIKQLGRLLGTEQYYPVDQYEVETQPDVYVMRVNGSLYFPNAAAVEDHILDIVATHPAVNSIVLVCSAMNTIDASAIHALDALTHELRSAGIQLCLAEVKPLIETRLRKSGFLEKLGEDCLYKSTFEAYLAAKVPDAGQAIRRQSAVAAVGH